MNIKRDNIKYLSWPIFIVLGIFVLDLITKEIFLAQSTDHLGIITTVIPNFFTFVCWFNTGGAWGILSNHTEILSLISLVFGCGIIWKFKNLHENHLGKAIALSFLLGGIWGNLFDRIFRLSPTSSILHPWEMFINQWNFVLQGEAMWGRGAVIDFLYFHCKVNEKIYSYPAFNIADIAICLGVGALIFFSFFFTGNSKETVTTKDSSVC